MDNNANYEVERYEADNFSIDPAVNNVLNEYLETGRLVVAKYGLQPQQISDIFHGVKEAIEVYHQALKAKGADVRPAEEVDDDDDIVGAASASDALDVPTAADFDLLVDVSEDIDRDVLTGMAVSLAKELRHTNVRVIHNRQEVVKSLADKAIKLSDVIFGVLLLWLKKNLLCILRGANHLNSIMQGHEYAADERNPHLLRELIQGISLIQTFTDSSGAAVIRVNLTRIEVYDKYKRILSILDSPKESSFKSKLLTDFKGLNGGPRRPGQKNETVALKVLEKNLGISSDEVRKIIKAAKLPWILASVWGRGSVMFLPSNKSGHTTLIGYLSSIEQVLNATCNHDRGLFNQLSEAVDELIIDPIAKGERLAIKQPTRRKARDLEESCIDDIIEYVRSSFIEEEDDGSMVMEMTD